MPVLSSGCSRVPDRAPLEWQGILHTLARPADRALRLPMLFLFEFDQHSEQSPLFILRASTGAEPRDVRVPLGEDTLSILNQATTAPLSLNVFHASEKLKPLSSFIARQRGVSALVAPVWHGEQLLGCLVGCATEHRYFTSAERSTFSLLASYVAVTVESALLRAETAFHRSDAMSLQAVSSVLVEEKSLDAMLAVIIEEAAHLLDASDALVLLLEEGGEWFRVRARRGREVAGLSNTRMSVKDSLNGLVVSTGEPLVSQDAIADPRADRERARRLNVHSVAIAPLKVRNTIIGTVAVHNKRNGYFSRADVEILCYFANQAAIAIDDANLLRELLSARDEIQRKAQELQELLIQTVNIQEGERRRIATDIHDRVISRVVGALYEVETCIQRHKRSEDLHEQLQQLKRLLNEVVQKTRESIYNLWPATLEHMGLLPALRELFSHQEERTRIKHALRVYGSPCELQPTVKIAVYRIVQEALNNVGQHAAANAVETSVRFGPQRLRVTVQDDGKGFDVSRVMFTLPKLHIGLIGMRERALGIGGTLHVESLPGKGSRIILEVPINGAGPLKGAE